MMKIHRMGRQHEPVQGNTSLTNLQQYLNAGYNAYHMAYSTGYYGADHKPQRIDNPYSQRPASDLWIKGWRAAQQQHEAGVPFSLNPFENDRRMKDYLRYLVTKDKSKNRRKEDFHTKAQARKPYLGKKPKSNFVPRPTQPKPAVLNQKRFDGFNNKHRTVA